MSKKKLLYVSCHETLEYDELRCFSELGFDCFSIGFWQDPRNPKTKMRPPIDTMEYRPDLIEEFKRFYPDYQLPGLTFGSGKVILNEEFVNKFDVIVFANYIENVYHNTQVCGDKPIILRTIAAPNNEQEHLIGLTYARKRPFILVRMSEAELTGQQHIVGHGFIRQCVDREVFKGWTGEDKSIFTVLKGIKSRPDVDFNLYEFVTSNYPRVLCGGSNEDVPYAKVDLTTPEIVELLNKSRVSYVQARNGACISYSFAESMMAGAPIVTMGKRFMGGVWEAEKIIKNGINGFVTNDTEEAKSMIDNLMNDEELAKSVGAKARTTALKMFDFDVIKSQWKEVLTSQGVM